jgi:molybdenum-dependent DNA-binding transcriptional regulator ModE
MLLNECFGFGNVLLTDARRMSAESMQPPYRFPTKSVMLLFDEVISTLVWIKPMTDEIGRIEPRIGLHDLRVLMVVVEAGSMGKAARLLATSQPAVSRSIGELEHALGVRLLDLSARGIEPTPYGRALLKRGTAVFDELQQSIKDIRFPVQLSAI